MLQSLTSKKLVREESVCNDSNMDSQHPDLCHGSASESRDPPGQRHFAQFTLMSPFEVLWAKSSLLEFQKCKWLRLVTLLEDLYLLSGGHMVAAVLNPPEETMPAWGLHVQPELLSTQAVFRFKFV